MTKARQAAERRGRLAEHWAALWLWGTGWRILDRRARTGAGELDLVARRGDILAFIEVKHRAHLCTALQAVTRHQQARLLRAAALWRARHPHLSALTVRFDVMVTTGWRPPKRVCGAFDARSQQELDLL